MELSRTSLHASSTTRFLQLPKASLTKFDPKIISFGQRSFPVANLRLPENSFPIIAPRLSYGRKINTVPLVKATADQNEANKSVSPLKKISDFSNVMVRFLRPHVLYGRTIGWAGIMTRIWMENAHLTTSPSWVLFLKAHVALVAIMCATGFVSSINQIYDIEIDKINKPFHPLVSGELSLQTAWMLVISFVAIGIIISVILKSGPLLANVLCTVALGVLYSVPPFSAKKSTIGAVLVNVMLGCVFVLSSALTARSLLGLPIQLSAPVIFMTTFDSMFKLASGVMKDIHDLEGDKKCNVPTLASIYGAKKIASFGFGIMLLNYVGAIAAAILMPQAFKRIVMIPAHALLAAFFIFQAWKLDKANYSKEASQSYYATTWRLICIQYILFPFI